MKKIDISAIRTDGGTQARLKLDYDVVKEYAECMKDGDKFPPVTVFHDGSEYWLANGFHRYFATKSNGENRPTPDPCVRQQRRSDPANRVVRWCG